MTGNRTEQQTKTQDKKCKPSDHHSISPLPSEFGRCAL
jgi:hypothetical protein